MNPDIVSFLSITAGILVASFYKPAFEYMFPRSARSMYLDSFWTLAQPYVTRFVAAMIIAAVVLALSKSTGVEMTMWWQSFLIGFGVNKSLDIFYDFRRSKAQS